MLKKRYSGLFLAVLLALSQLAEGQMVVKERSEFLGDYPPLEAIDGVANGFLWRFPHAEKKYRAVMYEQPEIFLHPESKCRGIQPDALKLVSDTLRDFIATKNAEYYPLTDRPGPGVVRVGIALMDVYLDKGRSTSWATQINGGTTGYALRAAVGRNLSLVEARIEVQVHNGETGERLAVIAAKVGQKEVDELKVDANPSSWSDLLRSRDNLSDAAQRRFADLFIEGSR